MQHLIKTVKYLLYTPKNTGKQNDLSVFQGEVNVAFLLINSYNLALKTLMF